jgi:hypothetical protein
MPARQHPPNSAVNDMHLSRNVGMHEHRTRLKQRPASSRPRREARRRPPRVPQKVERQVLVDEDDGLVESGRNSGRQHDVYGPIMAIAAL